MKVFQCIHKYTPYIPLLEKKYGITNDMDFETLQRIVVEDGYASAYILLPAIQHKIDEVFYTVWDYDRLQKLWAKKHGLKTNNLSKIKLAQMEEYRPDVFYNFSAFCDGTFIKKLGKNKNRKDLCWNGIIQKKPQTFPQYDGHVSLHRPYVKYWQDMGLSALELQPGVPMSWQYKDASEKSIDVLFYGQYTKEFFGKRNKIIDDLLAFKMSSPYNVCCHLTYKERQVVFKIPNLSWTRVSVPYNKFPSRFVREQSLPPLYGDSLYSAITKAKIIVNAYTDDNRDFKSNMRLFESIGLGAFLITEEGNYPDGLEPGVDFYTYSDSTSLINQIERVLDDWAHHAEIAQRTRKKISSLYSKERQWNDFSAFVDTL